MLFVRVSSLRSHMITVSQVTCQNQIFLPLTRHRTICSQYCLNGQVFQLRRYRLLCYIV